ncbi:MAG: hypothetical protein ACYSR6_06765, partial [Planctomycetota bacterium]
MMAAIESVLPRLRNIQRLAVVLFCSVVLFFEGTVDGSPLGRKKGYSCSTLRIMARLYMACGDY